MPQVCLYFQLHQPYRLTEFNVFDLGHGGSYFDGPVDPQGPSNRQVFQKVSQKSYIPMLSLLKELLAEVEQFRFTLSCSGVFLEQARQYEPQVLALLQDLAKTGRVEFLAETYYHSLAFLRSETEFESQVKMHQGLIKELFNQTPMVFRNTELIYSDHIAYLAHKMGFKGVLTEAVDRYLDHQQKTQIFQSNTDQSVALLLKHARLSDDIAFRFSNRSWQWYPLTAERYLEWLDRYPQEEVVNLFMDFETFGEHQWSDTGIFDFFRSLVHQLSVERFSQFVTPTQLFNIFQLSSNDVENTENISIGEPVDQKVKQYNKDKLPRYRVPDYISWADVDRDLTAWLGNQLQQDALRALYDLEEDVLASDDAQLIEDWRKLQTSDHLYYMCTKWSADGDVHAYFSPYQSPLEAYRRYSVVLADLRERLI